MIYNFDERIDRRASDSEKWRTYDEGVIPMWLADMDFISPLPVIQALQERVAQGVFGYPVGITGKPDETMEMRGLIVERLESRYGWQVQPEGTYLAWLDCRRLSIDLAPNHGSLFEFFLQRARVTFNDGAMFGEGGKSFVRLNFGCTRSLLVEALERVNNVLSK